MQALQCHPVRSAVYVALLIAGSLGTAHLAVAQEPTPDQQSAIRSNCRSDFMTNCSGVRSPRWRPPDLLRGPRETLDMRRHPCRSCRKMLSSPWAVDDHGHWRAAPNLNRLDGLYARPCPSQAFALCSAGA